MSDEEKKPAEEQAPEAAAPEAATEETPATEETVETPAEEPAKEETPAEEAPTEEVASEEAAEETPTEETPEAPAEETATPNPAHAYKEKLVGMTDIKPGMTVRLSERIKDISPKGEERERTQVFEGIILAMGGKGIARTLTIRKVSKGFGVEKIYPINSPVVSKIELVKSAKVRRAKLNYLKNPKRRFKRKLKETLVAVTGGKKKKRK